MKAEKIIVTIVVEGLSIDILRGQLEEVLSAVGREHICGCLHSDDGDIVTWKTEKTPVSF